MIDFFNVLDSSSFNQVFYTIGADDWQIWNKPNNAQMVGIFCLGGGGGGGAGQNGAGSTTRQGGGGGGSAGYSFGLFPANQIPDILYVQPGPGGTGGTGGTSPTSGTAGSLSYVSVEANTAANNIIMQSGAAAAGAGAVGSSSGTPGSAGTVWAGSNIAIFATAIAGQTGTTGTTAGTPGAITISKIVTGGAGGAGYSAGVNNGGTVTGSGFVPSIPGGSGNVNLNGTDGSGGFTSLNVNLSGSFAIPTFFTGGAGGGASNNFTGGAGGNGSFGSGGGGGGCGSTAGGTGASGGGAGGKGGDGIIIITCY